MKEFRLVTESGIVVLQTDNWKAAREAKLACQECYLQQLRHNWTWVTLTPNERMVLDVLHLDVADGI